MQMQTWKKKLILVVGLLEILIFSGTILGWTSLKLMLKKEGIYDYKCKNNSTIRNSNQTKWSNNSSMATAGAASKNSLVLPEENQTLTSTLPTYNKPGNNYLLRINFTFIDDHEKRNASLPGGVTLDDQKSRTIVIPFESREKYNETFIYDLLHNSPIFLKGNTSNAQVGLFNEKILKNSHNSNASSLEKFIHLYMEENLEDIEFESEVGCKEQEITLNLAFSIGSFCMGAAAFIWGFLLEKWGLRIVRLVINAMISIGAFLLCFCSRGNDWLLFPAILIMSLGGVPIRIANMQFSNLYPSKRSTIISIYSGAFSASSIIYVILQYIYEKAQFSFFTVNLILVLMSLLMIPFTLFILPPDRITEGGVIEYKDSKKKISIENGDAKLSTNKSTVFSVSNITLKNYKSVMSPTSARKNAFVNKAYINDEFDEKDKPIEEDDNYDANNNRSSEADRSVDPQVTSIPSAPPPLSTSLSSLAYNLHQLWFSWMITYMLLYVGSMNMWTQRVTSEKARQSSYVNFYGVVQVLALLISPLAGLLMDWQLNKANKITDDLEKRVKRIQSGFWPLFITNITLLVCVLCHYFDTEAVIYISIVFVTIYRAFLLAVGSAFLRIRFHATHFNRLLGIMSSVSAVASLLQIPLFHWESSSQSNVLYVNIFNTVVVFIVMSNPLYLAITPLQRYLLRKEDKLIAKSS